MPYCTLTEREVIDQLKANYLALEDVRTKGEYKYFYNGLESWTERSIVASRDKLVQTAVFAFRARVIGVATENSNVKKRDSVAEQAVDFTVTVCNDKTFIRIRGDEYYYCEQAGADVVDGPQAECVCQAAAKRIFTAQMAGRGYVYQSCVMEDWEYVSRSVETYTEYTVEYNCLGETKTLTAIASGECFLYYTLPVAVPVPEKKGKLGIIIGTILAVAVVAAVVVFAVLYAK